MTAELTLPSTTLPTHGGTWGLTLTGVRTVAVLELRQRVRSSRWVVVLIVWVGLLAVLTALIRWSVQRAYVVQSLTTPVGDATAPSADQAALNAEAAAQSAHAGRVVFGIIVFLVLSLGALISPALSATSVNGDRAAGVLATLQTTLLTPAEIVIGKLIAAWTVALALLVTALPFVLWSYLDGGTPARRLLVVLALLALTLLVVCAIGLGWSAITARTSTSAVLTYLTVALLGPGLPLLFALSLPLVSQDDTVSVLSQQQGADPNTFTCVRQDQTIRQAHTERSWWLLAASPYVILADAAPRPAGTTSNTSSDPLGAIRIGVREARLGPAPTADWCGDPAKSQQADEQRQREREALGITWPYGLAANLLLGGAFTALAVRRLRAPARSLPRGTRVA